MPGLLWTQQWEARCTLITRRLRAPPLPLPTLPPPPPRRHPGTIRPFPGQALNREIRAHGESSLEPTQEALGLQSMVKLSLQRPISFSRRACRKPGGGWDSTLTWNPLLGNCESKGKEADSCLWGPPCHGGHDLHFERG